MVLRDHCSLSLCGSSAIYLVTADVSAAFAFWVAGTLIDLDHLNDYWRDDGFNLNLRRFFGYFSRRGPRYLLLAFHGWEWPLCLLALAWGASEPLWLWCFAAGWLSHLILDQRFNRRQKSLGYFFAFRWSRGFKASEFYDGSSP